MYARTDPKVFASNVARAKQLMAEIKDGEELLRAMDQCEIGSEEMEQAEIDMDRGVL
jgi:hypothetical protein